MVRGKVAQFKFKLKELYTRITRNRLTAVFFLFGFFHCFAQGIIQSLLFVLDSQYYNLLSDITHMAKIPLANHTNLLHVSGGYTLEMCDFVPHNSSTCSTIFDSRDTIIENVSLDVDAQYRGETIISQLSRPSFKIIAESQGQSQDVSRVVFEADGGANIVTMNQSCTSMLLYPAQHFQNNKREEIAFMFLQFWLFVLSVIAMLHDSVPHVLTVFITRITLTAWSIYALWRTEWQQAVFQLTIETPGTPCSVAMFGAYFSTRILYEIPDIILNCTALGISAFLSLTLLRTYNAEVFTYVGAPKAIMTLHKYFLALQVCLQLEAFILITAAALWISQLFDTYVKDISRHSTVYEALFIFCTIVIGPWLLMAWYGIRSEKRWLTLAFILAGGLNFGKGLAQYLYAEANLSSSNFAPEVFERDVESTYVPNEKLKVEGLHADLTTHYIPTLGPTTSRDSYFFR
ncbi:hypothetical protein J3R30DRAFT_3700598 [Lentinula aciculospora]|uniref:Uncharacterized protein n=1 Tax=Lentinula aciculospora TaxID=153920 RepID=A0A9W9AFM4_9AGAR|nr:hypothetical protein J3R30DRAFT_3700598 [Lentinula aciculospora]